MIVCGLIVLRRLRVFRGGRSQLEHGIYLRTVLIGIALMCCVIVLFGLAITRTKISNGSVSYLWVRVASGLVEVLVAACFLFLGKYRALEGPKAGLADVNVDDSQTPLLQVDISPSHL